MKGLEPCPFCGGKAAHYYSPVPLPSRYGIVCEHNPDCAAFDAQGKFHKTKKGAAAVWNRRAARDAEIKRLKEALRKIRDADQRASDVDMLWAPEIARAALGK